MTATSHSPRAEVLQRLLARSPGGRFYKVDLHVHTPASRDHRWPGDTTPEVVLHALVAADLDLVAITDHFSGTWVDLLKEERRRLKRDSRYRGKLPVVLPGVEVATGGIHLTFVFPEDRDTAYVHHFLSQLAVLPQRWGDPVQTVNLHPVEVIRKAHELGGLAVGAHCDSGSGVVKGLEGLVRTEVLEQLDLLELRHAREPGKRAATVEHVRRLGFGDLPFVLSTDAHGPDELGGGCYVKMYAPSFRGLTQLVHEPLLRAAETCPEDPTTWLMGVNVVQSGEGACTYQDVELRFNPGLNVVIGGRGAGKSALLDTVRYGLHDPPKPQELRERDGGHHHRMRGLYTEGDIVQVFLRHDGELYCCERLVSVQQSGTRATPLFTADVPRRVYKLVEGEFVQVNDLPALGFEILSQGEIMDLVERRSDLLAFLDEYSPAIGTLKAAVGAQLDACRGVAVDVVRTRELEERLGRLREQQAEQQERAEEIARILASEVFTTYNTVAREKPVVERVRAGLLAAVSHATEQRGQARGVLASLDGETPTADGLEQGALGAVVASYGRFVTEIEELTGRAVTAAEHATAALAQWDTRYRAATDAYRESLRAQGKEGHDALAKDKADLEEANAALQVQMERLERDAAKRPEFEARFQAALTELQRCRNALRAARQDVIEHVNTQLSGRVRIELELAVDAAAFEEALTALFRGQQVRSATLARAAEELSPDALYQAVTQNNPAVLQAAGVTGTALHKFMLLVEHPQLFDLAVLDKGDVPQVYLNKGTRQAPLRELSHGERVSAILPILMLDKGLPLLIDQPEDDLDHAFITENVVASIRTAKSRRQVIAITHNPNIPVLGDADLVVKVERVETERRCQVTSAEGLEHPVSMAHLEQLEGGRDAFERRSRKYGPRPN